MTVPRLGTPKHEVGGPSRDSIKGQRKKAKIRLSVDSPRLLRGWHVGSNGTISVDANATALVLLKGIHIK